MCSRRCRTGCQSAAEVTPLCPQPQVGVHGNLLAGMGGQQKELCMGKEWSKKNKL